MTVSEDQILERVRRITSEVLHKPAQTITLESRFREDLGADSLDTVTLLMALEEEFKRPISDEEAKGLADVQSVVAFVKQNLGAGA